MSNFDRFPSARLRVLVDLACCLLAAMLRQAAAVRKGLLNSLLARTSCCSDLPCAASSGLQARLDRFLTSHARLQCRC